MYCSINYWKLILVVNFYNLLNLVHTYLTHSGRVTHICVGKLTTIASDNGLSPGRRQAIIWTNAGILLIGPLGTNFNETLIVIHTFSFNKMHLKMSSAKWRPFCLDPNALKTNNCYTNSFPVESVTHQGCNLSPHLFNIFINYFRNLLLSNNLECVMLNTRRLRCLMYADDIVLLSDSSFGIQKSLFILEVLCKKWHLSINTGKTKVIIFNERFSSSNELTLGNNCQQNRSS